MLADQKSIIKMRQHGFSLKEIASGLHLSIGTIVRYTKGIDIRPEFQCQWKAKRGGSAKRAERRRQEASAKVQALLGKLTTRDQIIIAACLYWGEGNKKEFSFSNTDPYLIKTFLACLRKLGVQKSRLKISIRIYEDIDLDEAKKYWAKIASIKPSEICSINVLSGKKSGKLQYGMCRIRLTKGNDYFNLLAAAVKFISSNLAPIAQRIRATDS